MYAPVLLYSRGSALSDHRDVCVGICRHPSIYLNDLCLQGCFVGGVYLVEDSIVAVCMRCGMTVTNLLTCVGHNWSEC